MANLEHRREKIDDEIKKRETKFVSFETKVCNDYVKWLTSRDHKIDGLSAIISPHTFAAGSDPIERHWNKLQGLWVKCSSLSLASCERTTKRDKDSRGATFLFVLKFLGSHPR